MRLCGCVAVRLCGGGGSDLDEGGHGGEVVEVHLLAAGAGRAHQRPPRRPQVRPSEVGLSRSNRGGGGGGEGGVRLWAFRLCGGAAVRLCGGVAVWVTVWLWDERPCGGAAVGYAVVWLCFCAAVRWCCVAVGCVALVPRDVRQCGAVAVGCTVVRMCGVVRWCGRVV